MTIGKLIKELQKMERKLGPRHRVAIDTDAFFNWDKDWRLHDVSKLEVHDGVFRIYGDEASGNQREHTVLALS